MLIKPLDISPLACRLTESDVIDLGDAKGVERRRIFPERFFAYSTSFSSLLVTENEPALTFPTINAGPQYVLLLAVLALQTNAQLTVRAGGKCKFSISRLFSLIKSLSD